MNKKPPIHRFASLNIDYITFRYPAGVSISSPFHQNHFFPRFGILFLPYYLFNLEKFGRIYRRQFISVKISLNYFVPVKSL